MDEVRWGLMSTANINRRLIPAIRASRRGQLMGVASRSQGRADAYAAEWQIPMAFGSYQSMLDSEDIDAIYISLPNHLHAEWTIRALHSGKHVLCEKPFALTVDDVDQMISTAQDTGRVLAEAFMYRHHPQTQLAGDWAREGRLGEITLVRSVFSFDIHGRPDPQENIRMRPEVGGGCLWDVGVYPLSFAQYIMGGPPSWVFGDQWVGRTGVDEVFGGHLHYSNSPSAGHGGMAQIGSAFRTPYYAVAEIIGTVGRLVLTSPFLPDYDGGTAQVLFFPAEGEPEVFTAPQKDQYLAEIEDMHAAILDGAAPYLTLEETRNHVRTVLALYESARLGQPVHLSDGGVY